MVTVYLYILASVSSKHKSDMDLALHHQNYILKQLGLVWMKQHVFLLDFRLTELQYNFCIKYQWNKYQQPLYGFCIDPPVFEPATSGKAPRQTATNALTNCANSPILKKEGSLVPVNVVLMYGHYDTVYRHFRGYMCTTLLFVFTM